VYAVSTIESSVVLDKRMGIMIFETNAGRALESYDVKALRHADYLGFSTHKDGSMIIARRYRENTSTGFNEEACLPCNAIVITDGEPEIKYCFTSWHTLDDRAKTVLRALRAGDTIRLVWRADASLVLSEAGLWFDRLSIEVWRKDKLHSVYQVAECVAPEREYGRMINPA
jgi:hypothetical protein